LLGQREGSRQLLPSLARFALYGALQRLQQGFGLVQFDQGVDGLLQLLVFVAHRVPPPSIS